MKLAEFLEWCRKGETYAGAAYPEREVGCQKCHIYEMCYQTPLELCVVPSALTKLGVEVD